MDQRGLVETMATAEDSSSENWQREDAVRALEFATSVQARSYVEFLARQPANDPVHLVACETLQRIQRREQVEPYLSSAVEPEGLETFRTAGLRRALRRNGAPNWRVSSRL